VMLSAEARLARRDATDVIVDIARSIPVPGARR
jgi:hypothetical protein